MQPLLGGHLLVAGRCNAVGGTPAIAFARWSPAGWSSVAGGIDVLVVNTNNTVRVLWELPNGDRRWTGWMVGPICLAQ